MLRTAFLVINSTLNFTKKQTGRQCSLQSKHVTWKKLNVPMIAWALHCGSNEWFNLYIFPNIHFLEKLQENGKDCNDL